jgi:molecular chaperone HtpG
MTSLIKFEVETQRVLEILSREIYDSPLALLRENIQNAYDAVLMRSTRDNVNLSTGRIDITLQDSLLSIKDNGIGMTEEVLRNNFWKAGSSGKRTQLASKAGVIGTFGIGAMANFGIATKLELTTRSRDSIETLRSIAIRDTLSIAEECISLENIQDEREEGTEIVVTLEPQSQLTEQQAKQYLKGYVQYVPVNIFLNGELISNQNLDTSIPFSTEKLLDLGIHEAQTGTFSFKVHVGINPQGLVRAEITDIWLSNNLMKGSLLLSQGAGNIMGYRNFFGLANIPVSTLFQLGGIANLSFLTPTAGREALGRDSIAQIQQVITETEKVIAEQVAKTEFADRSNVFQTYIINYGRYDLADNITVEVYPERESIKLSNIKLHASGRHLHYYSGRDPSLIQQFSNSESALILISQANPKRQIQNQYVAQILRINAIPDQAIITKEYSPRELTIAEAALLIRIATTLAEDYFLNDFEAQFVDITHGVEFLVKGNQQQGKILIARKCSPIRPLLECYETARDVFPAFIKDFVRNHVYPHVKHFVPSSTRGGADTLRQILKQNRELYHYEDSEFGELEDILSDLLAGETNLGEAIRKARNSSSNGQQQQSVQADQVGNIEAVIQDVVESPVTAGEIISETEPRPAIIRDDIECEFKILTSTTQHPNLNNFTLFLGLSDKLFKRELFFFKSPHTTRIMWGGHRIIYVFDHPSGSTTLYYDIELKVPLSQDQASGMMLPTTTLILKNRLFVPVPNELENEFRISEGTKQFYVNFDTIP